MAQQGGWAPDSRLDDLESARLRELELVDRIAGLEAELAQFSATSVVSPSTTLAAEIELHRVTTSPRWYAGRILELPYRALRRLRRARRR